MVNKSLSISSTVVQSVEELFDALVCAAASRHCRKCASRLLQMNTPFFSYGGKVWNLPLPVLHKLRANTIQPDRADVPTPATASSGFSSIHEKRNLMIHFDHALPELLVHKTLSCRHMGTAL